jgi:DNA-binding NarL/FixJ family response regulator
MPSQAARPLPRSVAKIPPVVPMTETDRQQDPDVEPAVKPRILIVEDEYLVAMTIEDDLRDAGYDIAGIATSADEALHCVRTDRPTLIIMDIRLNGARDGVDAALQIFKETGLRCVFATANADERSMNRAVAARPLGWLQKPYHQSALLAAIKAGFDELARSAIQ